MTERMFRSPSWTVPMMKAQVSHDDCGDQADNDHPQTLDVRRAGDEPI
jgi:hypothetical protein